MPASAIPGGIHAIVYALFGADERLDREAMRAQVEACIGAGVSGMAALGLATEMGKLSDAERRTVIDWIAEDTGGRVPLGITIPGGSVAEQISLTRHAEAAGADWVILQPPMVGAYGSGEYVAFFGRVADAARVPVAIQNAPAYIGRGLDADGILSLVRKHPNVRLMKAEGSSVEIAALVAALGPDIPVLNGRGGLELIENLDAGCTGMILAPELVDHAVRIVRAHADGDREAAEGGYAKILPAIVFVMQSLESMICYGKRLFAARANLGPIHDRAPAQRPTDFGLLRTNALAKSLGDFGA